MCAMCFIIIIIAVFVIKIIVQTWAINLYIWWSPDSYVISYIRAFKSFVCTQHATVMKTKEMLMWR